MARIAPSPRVFTGSGLLLGLLLFVRPVSAADVLLVSDAFSGGGLATILTADGHTVTSVTSDFAAGNAALKGPLGGYDAVYWVANGSATGSSHDDAAVFTNLSGYVTAGGRVFVTGYDSVASPTDSRLITFLGATGAVDGPGSPGAVAAIDSSLTTGLVDIRGVTPSGGAGDRDGLTGLAPGTINVVASSGASPDAQWILRPLGSGEIAYVSNGDSSGTHSSWSDTSAGGAGAYNAALRNFALAAETASADPGAPEITLDWPSSVEEGAALTLEVVIVDLEDDTYTFSWDLDEDGTFGEMPGATSYTIAAGTTDGPEHRRLAVEAVDADGNTGRRSRLVRIVNVAPTITSEPPFGTRVGAEVSYALTATDPAGAADPFTYRMIEGPAGASVSAAGVFSWLPGDADVTVGADAARIELEVADDDGGTATQRWQMSVAPNAAPEAGALVYPTGGIVLAEREPRLVVENGSDSDFEPLTYYFELDTVDTFDSPALLASGPLPEMPALTYWYPGDLGAGVYHWRAWVSDGAAQTEPQGATFRIYLPADSGLPMGDGGVDGGVPVDSGPPVEPGDGDGGGCSAAGAGDTSPWSFAIWLAAVGAVFTRRRRSPR